MKALAADPEARFATAREMAAALEACVPRAPIVEVAAWVERTAREALTKRAVLVAAIENGNGVGASGALAGSDEPTFVTSAEGSVRAPASSARPARRRAMIAAGALALAVLGGAYVAIRAHGPLGPARAMGDESLAPAPPRSAGSAAELATIARPGSAEPSPPSPPARSTAASAVPTPRRADTCKPPFTWDARGVKHYKPECM